MKYTTIPALFFVSEKNLNGQILSPRVPDNEFIKWGIEDGKTPRVCFARSIGKCLLALGRNLLGHEFYVFTPDNTYTSDAKLKTNIIFPTKDQVPDVNITHEVWVTTTVRLKYRMKIKVIAPGDEHVLVLKRRDTGQDYVGHPREWLWQRVLTPIEEIKEIFSKIHYGWRNPKTGKPFRTKDEFEGKEPEDVWRLGSPTQTINAECGNCYDTVAISRAYLKNDEKIQTRTFFMTTSDSVFNGERYTEAPTHTFLIYWDTDDYWKWLEGSWGPFKNNDWQTKNPQELITWIATAMANMEGKDIVVYELSSYPRYGCDMTEFERFCRQGNKVGVFHPSQTRK